MQGRPILACDNMTRKGYDMSKVERERKTTDEGLSAKVHHHCNSASPMYKKDSTNLFSRKNYPKSIYNILYLGQGSSLCKSARSSGGLCAKAPPLKIMLAHMINEQHHLDPHGILPQNHISHAQFGAGKHKWQVNRFEFEFKLNLE